MNDNKIVAGLIGGGLIGGSIAGWGNPLGSIGCIIGAILGIVIVCISTENMQ